MLTIKQNQQKDTFSITGRITWVGQTRSVHVGESLKYVRDATFHHESGSIEIAILVPLLGNSTNTLLPFLNTATNAYNGKVKWRTTISTKVNKLGGNLPAGDNGIAQKTSS